MTKKPAGKTATDRKRAAADARGARRKAAASKLVRRPRITDAKRSALGFAAVKFIAREPAPISPNDDNKKKDDDEHGP